MLGPRLFALDQPPALALYTCQREKKDTSQWTNDGRVRDPVTVKPYALSGAFSKGERLVGR